MLLSFTLELDKLAANPLLSSHADWKTLSTSFLGLSGLGNLSVFPSFIFASHCLFQRMPFLRKCAILLLKGSFKG